MPNTQSGNQTPQRLSFALFYRFYYIAGTFFSHSLKLDEVFFCEFVYVGEVFNQAGIDQLVIEGRADTPVRIEVIDGDVRILDAEPELFVEWAGGTDGRFYRYSGIQTVGFGPKGEHAHGPDEFVHIDSLVSQARVYLALVAELSEKNRR